ncbi:hypothetical protein J2Y38_002119 [Flavobacterium sp. 2755]|uniref:sacsin N-terminal ATP-binding-like domain-containing protein n=1 Tax=Flavobacterium sp. 2755 TaxID=2817765 RepID=UPI002866A773|nr:caspase family protein [Flavobacterium sp. 2755]MDR6761910.1 hypothetical protein [Flavobacterium sp. 2755]
MSLKNDVESIFKKNIGYAEPEHAVNQAESLKSLSADLYTDSKRFIYELLQNADDSSISGESVKAGVRLFGDFLVVAHTGKPFDQRDLRGICGVSDGTKKNLSDKTGYKGIGFKAVFGYSERVTIYSAGEFFRFDSQYDFGWNMNWGNSQKEWEADNERKFSFPWHIIPIYTEIEEIDQRIRTFLSEGGWSVATIIFLATGKDNVKRGLEELASKVNMYLFLKKIEELDFRLENISSKITLDRQEQDQTVQIKLNGTSKASWLLRTVKLEVPEVIRLKLRQEKNIPDKLLNLKETELTFAAKLLDDGIKKLDSSERLLYSYLPTEEARYAIPVLVNSSFVLGSNRETLHEDSKWNQWLFENIPVELLKWIAELVKGKYGQNAYELIPSKSNLPNSLGSAYSNGLTTAFSSTAFILTNQQELIKISQSIIDFTSISKRPFITEAVIRGFVMDKYNRKNIHLNPFLPYTVYGKTFKDIGAACFEWENVPELLESEVFAMSHTFSGNIQLIAFLKQLCESESQKNVSEIIIKKWPFIMDHKGKLHYPNNIYFPAPDDRNWNDPESEISFLHLDVQKFLLQNPETRIWLEQLGVSEKTDLSYFRKTIVENASTYSTHENSIETIASIFSLYVKREIGIEELEKLSDLKLLTMQGNLVPAVKCYFADSYFPRLPLESEIADDIFITDQYLPAGGNVDEWRRFFKMMGVREGITAVCPVKMTRLSLLRHYDFKSEFFELDDKFFKPLTSTFKADEYSSLSTLIFLDESLNVGFSKIFWSDVIKNIKLDDINISATAYWGNPGRPGRTRGNEIKGYLKWYIQTFDCIPTVMGILKNSNNVFLNSDEILQTSGGYLPVFLGAELTQDWRSFFSFKTNLELRDYLKILQSIALDLNSKGIVKRENSGRIQYIYKKLLDQCANWSDADILQVKEWSASGLLLSTKNEFIECSSLKYFIDGNESVFQDQFNFMSLNGENQTHPELEFFLHCFNINVLFQSDFDLVFSGETNCSSLVMTMHNIIPYFRNWIESESADENTIEFLKDLAARTGNLNIYQTDELQITYDGIDFVKNVNVHFDMPSLYVTAPWTANSVLLKLPEILCRYFNLQGHDKKLDFLLRSDLSEIQRYFDQEGISIPEEQIFQRSDHAHNQMPLEKQLPVYGDFRTFSQIENAVNEGGISPEFFHLSRPDFEKMQYVQQLVSRAVKNVEKYLSSLQEYDFSGSYPIAESIIGGIIKNGNEIAVVARPSDGDQVLVFYTSEFDVLDYADAEFWCEDGINIPQQITLGKLLKKTGINRIPIKNNVISDTDFDLMIDKPKSEVLDFSAVPFAPEKTARIISSFANTEGGTLIFGLKEGGSGSNEMVGLSSDFRVAEIIKKAVSLLSPIPVITYGWVKKGEDSIFVISTEKANEDVLFNGQKFIREEAATLAARTNEQVAFNFKQTKYDRTVAIIISIENYAPRPQGTISNVKYANSDALRFKNVLKDHMKVSEEDIHMFVNEEALKVSLEYDLLQLFHYLKENDRLIFYYVGHGFHNGVSNFLSTYDMHKHNISETAVSLRKILLDPLRNSKCKTALIFIDACAQSFKDENGRNEISDINEEELLLLTNDFPYYGTFLSCQPGQSSYSSDVLMNGVWTHHLVNAISGNIPEVLRNDKYITDRLLMDYLSKTVSEYIKNELNYVQNPRAVLDSSNENVILEII